jgi:hypothetical protein
MVDEPFASAGYSFWISIFLILVFGFGSPETFEKD